MHLKDNQAVKILLPPLLKSYLKLFLSITINSKYNKED